MEVASFISKSEFPRVHLEMLRTATKTFCEGIRRDSKWTSQEYKYRAVGNIWYLGYVEGGKHVWADRPNKYQICDASYYYFIHLTNCTSLLVWNFIRFNIIKILDASVYVGRNTLQ
jgi:hypothetical protein